MTLEYDPIETATDAAQLARDAAGLLLSIPESLQHRTLFDQGCLVEVAIRLEHLVEWLRIDSESTQESTH
jgi:hypothetical protein